jgi:hypothetical protein
MCLEFERSVGRYEKQNFDVSCEGPFVGTFLTSSKLSLYSAGSCNLHFAQ